MRSKDFTVNVSNVNEAPTVSSTDGSFDNHIVNTSTAYNPVANATVGAYLYSNDSAGVAKPASNLLNGVDAVEHDPVSRDAGVGDLPEGSRRQPQHDRHLPVRR